MDLDTAPQNAQTGKFLFDASEEWLRVDERHEPDLAVDGLRDASLLARVFGKLLKGR